MSGYELTETAEDELREILSYIAEADGLHSAEHVLESFLEACGKLATSPGIGYKRRQLTGDQLRWWPVFRYLMVYDPEVEPLRILRIIHGNRDLDRVLREES